MTLWSKKAKDLLIKLYSNPKITKEDLMAVFPEKTWNSIQQEAYALKQHRRFETYIDEEALKAIRKVIKI